MMRKVNKRGDESGILTELGKKVRSFMIYLIAFFCLLAAIDNFYLKKECRYFLNDEPELTLGQKPWQCFWSPIASDIYSSILTSIITILFVDLALHEDNIKKIGEIFKSTDAARYFHPTKRDYEQKVIDDIKDAANRSNVKILGLTREISVLDEFGHDNFTEKISRGCDFRILIIHPNSSILKSIDECLEESLTLHMKSYKSFLKMLMNSLKKYHDEGENIKGKLEIRLHKDTFTPICYYSGIKMNLVWMYLSNGENFAYPAFTISNEQILSRINSYFEYLWSNSENDILLYFPPSQEIKKDEETKKIEDRRNREHEINEELIINNIDKYF